MSVWPTTGWPATTGRTEFVGASPPTTSVASDVPVAEPEVFVALTVTRIVCWLSAVTRTYRGLVAPVIATQFSPVVSQRSHWKE